jgi:amino acid adenylation domain-containing protein
MNIQAARKFLTFLDWLQHRASDLSGTQHQVAFTYLSDGDSATDSITFLDLDRRARSVAAHLQELARPGDRVLLVFPPGLDFIVAFVGCIYAGVIAVPALPPANARALPRLQLMVMDAQPRLALTTSRMADRIKALSIETDEALSSLIWLATDSMPDASNRWTRPDARTSDIVFLQYTSGSTGSPKGVMVSHENILANAGLIHATFALGSGDAAVSWLPPYHDMGLIGKILVPIYVGGHCIQLPPAAFLMRPLRWLKALSDYRARMTSAPNFAYELCVRKISSEQALALDLRSLEFVLNGAEPVRADTLRRFASAFSKCGLKAGSLVPVYGLAESTLMVSAGRLRASEELPRCLNLSRNALAVNEAKFTYQQSDSVEIASTGPALSGDHEVIIVDPHSRVPRPDDTVGEIWVRGPSVARGYWQRPDESERTFRATPTGSQVSYLRTGDLGFVHEGELFVTGRIKEMMIFRGRNSYPEDVEATVERLDAAFRPGGCAAFSLEKANRTQLVIVQELEPRGRPALDGLVNKVRAEIAEQHEIVDIAAIVLVKAGQIPRTTSGKLQRLRCREMFQSDELASVWDWKSPYNQDAAAAYVAPVTQTEVRMAAIWEELFDVRPISVTSDFFALGGDSLRATQLGTRIRDTFQVELQIEALFEAPTVGALALRVEAARKQLPGPDAYPIVSVPRDGALPLSFAQQRLWFLAQFEGGSSAYHIAGGIKLSGHLDRTAMLMALDRIVARHEALRTRFAISDGLPMQRIVPDGVGFAVKERDLRGCADAEAQLRRLAEEEATARFDLEQGPLIRGQLLRLAEEEHVLLVTMHHIVADGWSMGLLVREFAALYGARIQGLASSLPELPIQHADFAHWQRQSLTGEVIERELAYWKKCLSGAPIALAFPTDRPRPAMQSFRGARQSFTLSPELSRGLADLAQREGATVYMVLLAAFALLLSRYSGEEDIVIGSPIAGRRRPELEGLIGLFVNTLALRVDLSGEPSFLELLRRTKETALAAYDHQDLPFDRLVEELRPARDLSRQPVFQVMLAMLNVPQEALRLPGLTVRQVAGEAAAAQFDLSLHLFETPSGLQGHFDYATDLFDAGTIERLASHLTSLLEGIVLDSQRCLSELPLLSEVERHRLLVEWNATDAEYPQQMCIHELFEAQVERTPDAAAVVQEDRELSYGELNAKANRLAHHLRALGVGPDDRVAICVERSVEMVVGILAVLKAGGAYVPLDPSYPRYRFEGMLNESAPVVVLTQAGLLGALDDGVARIPVLALDRDEQLWCFKPETNLSAADLGLTSGHLAYVIYTSGSSGQPKGVMNEHGGVVNRLIWMQRAYGLNRHDAVMQKTPFSFDVSVWEFFWPLLAGARLVLARHDGHKDPGYLAEMVDQQRITTMHFVPSMLQVFLDHCDAGRCTSLARVMCSGEALPGGLLRRFRSALSETTLYNLYGPTEAAIDVTAWSCTTLPDNPPIGCPISNTQIYILDRHGEVVPVGASGEIYIGGAGVARGYLNRPDLTAERFVASPFAAGERLYRTGDMARYLADGTIEYLGRNDHQVKLRGFRIELGEIEARLSSYPGVREAAVVVREEETGDKRLIGYYTRAGDGASVEVESLRDHLSMLLPDYMVPAAYVHLDAFPLTPNGKLDRRRLPAPEGNAYVQRGYEAPQGEMEETLASIWAVVLGQERVGRHDNFFELGGHSLLALRLLDQMRQLGLDANVRDLLGRPTVSLLATATKKFLELEL